MIYLDIGPWGILISQGFTLAFIVKNKKEKRFICQVEAKGILYT